LVTLAFENNGVRPYDLTLKGLKPITIARVTASLDGEPAIASCSRFRCRAFTRTASPSSSTDIQRHHL